MSLSSSKTKKTDEFDIIKSQLEDLKNLVDNGKDKNGSQEEKQQQEPDNEQRKEDPKDVSDMSDTDDSDNEGSAVDGNLLNSLSNDVHDYHKKVQMKKEKSHIKKEKIIAKELEKQKTKNDNGTDKSMLEAANAIAVVTAEHGGQNEDNHHFEDSDEENDLDDIDDEDDDAQAFSGLPIEVNFKGRKGRPVSKKRKVSRSKKIYPWTKAEDEAIVYYKEDQKYSWKKIEEQLDFKHTWQAIQMRYLRNHKSRNEEWSRFMEVKLISAIRKDWESRWKRIGADLGKDFSSERCIQKNMEICKRMDMDYVKTIFENKEILSGYKNPFNDIKDAEAHKKLMLVYMGLDAITYEDSEEEEEEEEEVEEKDNESGTFEQNDENIQNEQKVSKYDGIEKGV